MKTPLTKRKEIPGVIDLWNYNQYCCMCFEILYEETIFIDEEGQKHDICMDCKEREDRKIFNKEAKECNSCNHYMQEQYGERCLLSDLGKGLYDKILIIMHKNHLDYKGKK